MGNKHVLQISKHRRSSNPFSQDYKGKFWDDEVVSLGNNLTDYFTREDQSYYIRTSHNHRVNPIRAEVMFDDREGFMNLERTMNYLFSNGFSVIGYEHIGPSGAQK